MKSNFNKTIFIKPTIDNRNLIQMNVYTSNTNEILRCFFIRRRNEVLFLHPKKIFLPPYRGNYDLFSLEKIKNLFPTKIITTKIFWLVLEDIFSFPLWRVHARLVHVWMLWEDNFSFHSYFHRLGHFRAFYFGGGWFYLCFNRSIHRWMLLFTIRRFLDLFKSD